MRHGTMKLLVLLILIYSVIQVFTHSISFQPSKDDLHVYVDNAAYLTIKTREQQIYYYNKPEQGWKAVNEEARHYLNEFVEGKSGTYYTPKKLSKPASVASKTTTTTKKPITTTKKSDKVAVTPIPVQVKPINQTNSTNRTETERILQKRTSDQTENPYIIGRNRYPHLDPSNDLQIIIT